MITEMPSTLHRIDPEGAIRLTDVLKSAFEVGADMDLLNPSSAQLFSLRLSLENFEERLKLEIDRLGMVASPAAAAPRNVLERLSDLVTRLKSATEAYPL